RLTFTRLHAATGHSRADLTGSLTGLNAPSGTFQIKAQIAAGDAVSTFALPIRPTGAADVDGTLSVNLGPNATFSLNGSATARGLGYVRDRVNVSDVSASTHFVWDPKGITLSALSARVLGAKFSGKASLTTDRVFHLDGNFEDLQLANTVRIATD